jgi:uncharacterized protein
MVIAKTTDGLVDLVLNPKMANRHGLISGATGTGKTVTLQAMAEAFSDLGVPVFAADIKGDLSGVSQVGGGNPKVDARLGDLKMATPAWSSSPIELWDVFGEQGTPIRATVLEMGPLLISRLLALSDVQEGVLNIVFKYCDDNKLALIDLKDLRTAVQYVGDNADQFTAQYGNVAPASIGAIQRALLQIETQSGTNFFGEPAVRFMDFIRTNSDGKGVINLLAADKLFQQPLLYSTFLLWMLSELYENLPEVGDLEKPKLVFFFDEAHLIFTDAPKALTDKVEQVIRLIRSKGVGIYFVTQNPADIPDSVLGQLGNRVQHALRAFTPNDQKGIRAAANTFRPNPKLDVEKVITEMGVGEALVSFLDEKGSPTVTERGWIIPPKSHIGAIDSGQRQTLMNSSNLRGQYLTPSDPESAFEILQAKMQASRAAEDEVQAQKEEAKAQKAEPKSRGDGLFGAAAKSLLRSIGSGLGREITRGIFGNTRRR